MVQRQRERRSIDLTGLESKPRQDFRLASIAKGRLEGLAYRYTVILPLFSEETGEEIFSVDRDLPDIVNLFGRRFGGCTISSVSRGTWLPAEGRRVEADRILQIYVYTKQQEGVIDSFFQRLKYRLKRHGKQEEVVIEKIEVRLLSARTRPD
jgi:hypothetical protein